MKTALGILIAFLFVLNGPAGPQAKKDAGSAQATRAEIDAPKNLTLKAVTDGIELRWKPGGKDTAHITGYQIVRSIQLLGGPYDRIATVDKNVNQHIDRTPPVEVIVYYKVRAVAGGKYSPYSNTAAGERFPKRP